MPIYRTNYKKFFLLTYGCQMNESDSEKIATLLEQKGYQPATEEQADLIVINMCSVRQSAVDRVYYKISNLKSKILNLQLKTKILLTGCVLDKDKKRFAEMGVRFTKFNLEKITPKTCYVPIMTGCNNFCSYCVVPYTKGRERFKPKKDIIGEIKHLLKSKHQKIILLGQNVNSYPNFVSLLKQITKIKKDFKISFLTNHPKDFSNALIDEIAQNKKISKEIHLPVQSGDNKILRAMNRKYTREDYLRLVQKIKNKIPGVELTTDVIVGFPGETKKAFENTLNLFKKVKFSNAYIAKYSPRPGTAAYFLPDNITPAEKKERYQQLREVLLKPKASQ